MLNSFLSIRRDLEQDNGNSSALDQNRNGILLTNTNHKETGTELLNKWCWHLQKANTQYSDPRVHYPEECSKANKEGGNCQYTIASTRERLKLFFAQLFLLISSIFPEQLQICVKNVTHAMIKQKDRQWDMFPEPTELLLIVHLIESIWITKSKIQFIDAKKTTCKHADQEKLHTWWMESSFVFVWHWPFQFYRLFWSDVEKNAKRFRYRKSHSKVETDDEFGLAMQQKDSWCAAFYCIRKPGENQTWK